MRAVFFLLVFANLLLFAWGQGYFGARDAGREPQRLTDQLNPEALRIVREVPVAKPVAATACRLVAALPAADAAQLAKAAEAEGWQATLRTIAEPASFIVTIPELANRAAADKKAGELRALGIVEFAVTPAGSQFAISFAQFRDEAAAREFLATLGKKGVRSARIDSRGPPARATVDIRGPADTLGTRLPELIAPFAGATLGDCAS